jgi:hypothetical protein
MMDHAHGEVVLPYIPAITMIGYAHGIIPRLIHSENIAATNISLHAFLMQAITNCDARTSVTTPINKHRGTRLREMARMVA